MYLYHMPFRLTRPVNDIEKASAYLTADQMIDYLLDDSEVLKSARDRVFQIEWQLSTATTGNVVLVSKKPLTNVELGSIAGWVMSQNSDGLGEGFEQQPFACYLNDEEYEADLEETREYIDPDNYYSVASFSMDPELYHFSLVNASYVYKLGDFKNPVLTEAKLEELTIKEIEKARKLIEDSKSYLEDEESLEDRMNDYFEEPEDPER